MASIISAGTTSGTSLNLSGDTSGVLQLASNGSTTAVTIDTSQNVGIGTSSVNTTAAGRVVLEVNGSSNALINISGGGARRGTFYADSTDCVFGSITSIPLEFLTGGVERMRIDSSGSVGIGTSSPTSYGSANTKFVVTGSGRADAWFVGGTSSGGYAYFSNNAQTSTANTMQIGQGWTSGTDNIGFLNTNGANPLLFATNGVERMRIDSSGRVTTPSQPVFRASLSSDVLISTTSPTKIPYNVVDFNVGSNFNTTTNRFTAPIAGKYLVCVTYNVYNVAGGSYSRSSIYLNGGLHQHLSMNFSDVTNDHVYTGSMIMNLGASDYVEVFTESNDSSYSLSGTFVWNTFSGYLLG